MPRSLTDIEHQIIHQLVLDRWNPHRINKKIASHFGLTVDQVRHIRRKPEFREEYARQLTIYQHSCDDIELSDRKERVKALAALYEKIPDVRVALKLKVLRQIREEMGHDRQVVEHRTPLPEPDPTPPSRAQTYEEWLAQSNLQ